MVLVPNPDNFGESLSFYRNRTLSDHGRPISLDLFSDLLYTKKSAVFSRDQLYKWENGKTEVRPTDRNTLLAIMQILVMYGGINSIEEANQLVFAAGLKNLDPDEIQSLDLNNPIFVFRRNLRQNKPNDFAETGNPTSLENLPDTNAQKNSDENTTNLGDVSSQLPAAETKSGGGRFYFSAVDQFARSPLPKLEGIENQTRTSYRPSFTGSFDKALPKQRPGLAPSLPTLFIGRDKDIKEIKERLLNTPKNGNIQVLTAIRGWPGVGKTTIAAALAYEPDIIKNFPDGILWTSLGPVPALFTELITWCDALGLRKSHKGEDIKKVSAALAAFLRQKRVLLLIDDVWNADDATPFKVGGPKCATLITTRLPETATKIVGSKEQIYPLGVLSDEASYELMSKLAPSVCKNYPKGINDLVRKLEGLPLALQVAGRLLQTEESSGFSVTDLINEISDGERLLSEKVPPGEASINSNTSPTVAALLYKSLNHIDSETRKCYAKLGAFAPAPAKFDLNFLSVLWKVTDAKPIVKKLIDRGLLEYIPNDQLYQMHSLLVMLAKTLWNNPQQA